MRVTWSAARGRAAIAIAVAALGATFVAACGSSDNDSTSTATEAAATSSATTTADSATTAAAPASVKGKKVVLVSPDVSNPWMKAFTDHIKQGLEAQGVTVKHLQDPYDPNRNVQNLNLAIAQKPDLVLEVPIDDHAIVPSLGRAKAADVPVINLNGPPSAETEALVAGSYEADHAALGKFAAQNVIEGLEAENRKKANIIAITGNAASSQVPARMDAFKKELASHPEYKLVAVEDGNWDLATSAKIAQQLFAKYASQGGIQAAYGMADNQALGIVQAADQAGLPIGVKKDGLIVTGSNCFKVGIDAIKAGQMFGTATQAPGPQGDFSAQAALKFLSGEQTGPKRQFSPEKRVTAETAADAEAECTY